ncbi:conserved hypothetical protein [Candidatus Methylobacter favarea]|uniref:DUF883 domain-containing protein n=1 Tax=Candidatus Methylobacter favarea TaxID=2707345 RepID=A0A8S0Y6A5_9GAMM|nr:DUF883 family protein [Candidatus Methylobacter favarea]CAA9890873.1 conserved hypothetical protein [Candidatus Methylobacter favarea]
MTASSAEQLSKAAGKTVERVKADAHEAVETAANVSRQAAKVMGEKGEQMKHLEEQFVENCRNYVHDKPVTSLGVAVALGFLLSRLVSTR